KPCSVMVGTPGSASTRLSEVTASGRSLPASICGLADSTLETMDDTWPASTSLSAGAAPLYGTWTTSMPAALLNSSIATWSWLPTPADALLSLPGCRLAAATSSATLATANEGCTTSTLGSDTSCVIGAKSRATS